MFLKGGLRLRNRVMWGERGRRECVVEISTFPSLAEVGGGVGVGDHISQQDGSELGKPSEWSGKASPCAQKGQSPEGTGP